MTSGISLPTIDEAEAIIGQFFQMHSSANNANKLGDVNAKGEIEERWRALCMAALSYGTDYNYFVFPEKANKNTSNIGMNRSNLPVKVRAKKTCDFFLDLFQKEQAKILIPNEIDVSTGSNPQFILVDSLWFVSSLLANTKKEDFVTNDSLESLFIIIQGLASKLPPVFTKRIQMTLDAPLLTKFKLVPEENVPFSKKAMKYATNMLYRQKKFNLLVEESEGYSKLLIFLFSSQQLLKQEQNSTVIGKIRELMGSFYLDPNRVLDLTLLVLEFYLEKVRNGEQIEEVLEIILNVLKEFKRESLPQLIGFKFSSLYKSTEDQEERNSLFLTCAYLICHGLLQLKDLIPHLELSIKDMMSAYEENRSNVTKRIRQLGKVSLGSTSNVAADESKKSNMNDNLSSDQAKVTSSKNQVISLFEFLLYFQAWEKLLSTAHLFCPSNVQSENHGVKVLSQACTISPKIAHNLCQMINDAIEPVYDANFRRKNSFFINMKECRDKSKSNTRKDGFELLAELVPKSAKMKVVENIEELVDALYTPLIVITDSGCIHNEPTLYCKLCRLFKELLSQKEKIGKEQNQRLTSLLQVFLVPSLSLFPSNPSISSELWSCLLELPYTTRYLLYDAWRGTQLERRALRLSVPPPCISSDSAKYLTRVESEVLSGIECRYTLKRLSKENIQDSGRQLAKTCHNNPIVVFTTVLNQIETYDNLIELMVDSFRYVTKLSLDVLAYCLLWSLGGGGKNTVGRMKTTSDGMGTSQWLTSLSQFTGVLYKKFPEIEIRGIISHLIHELRHGKTAGLLVLRNLLTNAGGYDFADCDNTSSLSLAQLEGRSGSQLLKRETSSFGIVEGYNITSSTRLKEVLQDKTIGLPLLILIAQVKEKIMFESKSDKMEYLKVIGKNYDSCHTLLGMLLEFLTDLSNEQNKIKYAEMIPTVAELTKDYGMNSVNSWMLCRPLVRSAVFADKNIMKTKRTEEEGEEKEENETKKRADFLSKHLAPYHPSSEEMLSTYKELIPSTYWKVLTPSLYGYFWALSLYDISCPESRYSTEITRLTKEYGRMAMKRDPIYPSSKDEDAERKRLAEKFRVKKSVESLGFDQQKQRSHTKFIHSLLESKKSAFFPKLEDEISKENSTIHLISTCTFPRCILSPEDAMYCARFIKILHGFETPEFYTLQYLDHLIAAICGSLFCVTEDEAGNMGVLLRETWLMISSWRYDESKFEKDIMSKPGALILGKNIVFTEYKEYYNKWHLSIGISLIGCLQSKEYIHIRAAIIVLSRIVDVYPTRPRLGEKLMKNLIPLQEDSSRPDIKVMANAYAAQLEKARREGVWKEQDTAKTNKIIEEEKMKAEEKKKDAERRLDAMKKENEQIERDHLRSRGGHRFTGDRPHSASRRHDTQPLSSQASVFTPANGAPRDLYLHAQNRDSHRPDNNAVGASRGPYVNRDRDRDRDWDRDRDRERPRHDVERNRERSNVKVGAGPNIQNIHGHVGHLDSIRGERSRDVRASQQPRGNPTGRDYVNSRGISEVGMKRDARTGDRDPHPKRQRVASSTERVNPPPLGPGSTGNRGHGHSRRLSPERGRLERKGQSRR